MVQDPVHDDLDESQRKQVVIDLVAWKVEENRRISDEDLKAWRAQCKDMSDRDLAHMWFTTVGEWLCHRGDMPARDGTVPCEDGDELTELQFERLIDPEQTTDYGWVA